MSYDPWEAARDEEEARFYDKVSGEAIENFTAYRLKSFYENNRNVAQGAFASLDEAKSLLATPHHTAAFIHATITLEAMLKEVVLKPIIHGFIHDDPIAPVIVKLAAGYAGLDRFKDVIPKILRTVCNIDLNQRVRVGGSSSVWEEIQTIQKQRNDILHRAQVIEKKAAEHAVGVATFVTHEVFPVLAKSLGYHLHDGYRLCDEWKCTLPPKDRQWFDQMVTGDPDVNK